MVFHTRPNQRANLALTIAMAFSASLAYGDDARRHDLDAPTVEVVGTTPIPGLGTRVEQVLSNVQIITGKRIGE
jgi:hypothetical protein